MTGAIRTANGKAIVEAATVDRMFAVQKKQPVKAAALNDMVLGLQHLLKSAKRNPKQFLGALELVHEIVDKDTAAANATRRRSSSWQGTTTTGAKCTCTTRVRSLSRAIAESMGVLDKVQGYTPTEVDRKDAERQFPQRKGQFLVGRDGIVRWANVECAAEGLAGLGKFPTDEELVEATGASRRATPSWPRARILDVPTAARCFRSAASSSWPKLARVWPLTTPPDALMLAATWVVAHLFGSSELSQTL